MNEVMNTAIVFVEAGLIAWVPASVVIIRIITRPRTTDRSYQDHVSDATAICRGDSMPDRERAPLSLDDQVAWSRIVLKYRAK